MKHVVVDVDDDNVQYVPCLYDRRLKKDFRKKFEDKYNVVLMETARVFGFGKGFSVCNHRIDVPYEIEPLDYSYVVVGNLIDIKNAIKGINKSLDKYIIERNKFPNISREKF